MTLEEISFYIYRYILYIYMYTVYSLQMMHNNNWHQSVFGCILHGHASLIYIHVHMFKLFSLDVTALHIDHWSLICIQQNSNDLLLGMIITLCNNQYDICIIEISNCKQWFCEYFLFFSSLITGYILGFLFVDLTKNKNIKKTHTRG